ncbi:MAG: tetratricopeptide repeat protein [Azospirillum sp.]|nr:tetratricopeptide repeat protein [Azospirillum sp.]
MGDYRDLLREGLSLQQAGQFQAAAERYRTVLAERPEEPNATYLLGVALHQMGDSGAAVPLLERAVIQRPDFPDAHNNLGEALRAMKRHAEAIACFERALALSPGHAAYLTNLSHALRAKRDFARARETASAALRIEPNLVPAMVALGNAAAAQGDLDAAFAAFDSALALAPQFADALANRADLSFRCGNWADAVAALERLRRTPAGLNAAQGGMLARALAKLGAHETAGALRAELVCRPDEAASAVLFYMNYEPVPVTPLFELHRLWGQALEARTPEGPAIRRPRAGRMKIGFVSADFRRHSVAAFVAPLWSALDRGKVEIVAVANVGEPDATTAALRESADVWIDIHGRSDRDAEAAIRAADVDILIDLSGHSGGNRLGVFARRAAPVQATWLGYPNTTGLSRIAWRFTDSHADPEAEPYRGSERLWRLPGGFLRYRPMADHPMPGQRPPGPPRFGSFNALEKVSPACWQIWMDLLRAEPEARLVLKTFALQDAAVMADWRARARASGFASRIDLLSFVEDDASHLRAYDGIDVALDPFPYNGTTTTCEALSMGVPVVGLRGDRHCARVGESLAALAPADVSIADTAAAYIAMARAKLKEPGDREARARAIRNGPLCDAASLARAFETAFEAMYCD